MQLFCSPSSPYVRKARITVQEKGLEDSVEEVTVVAMESAPELLASNPLSKIPALTRPGQTSLFDSPVICEYLDSLPSNSPSLLPATGEERWQILCDQALADGITDAAFNLVMEGRRDEETRSGLWQDRWTSAILRALDRLEDQSDEMRAAYQEKGLRLSDIAIGAALGYLDLRLDHLKWRDSHPGLASFFESLMQRPAFQDTVPKDPA